MAKLLYCCFSVVRVLSLKVSWSLFMFLSMVWIKQLNAFQSMLIAVYVTRTLSGYPIAWALPPPTWGKYYSSICVSVKEVSEHPGNKKWSWVSTVLLTDFVQDVIRWGEKHKSSFAERLSSGQFCFFRCSGRKEATSFGSPLQHFIWLRVIVRKPNKTCAFFVF